MNRNQQDMIEYLQEEIRVPKEMLGTKPRFHDGVLGNDLHGTAGVGGTNSYGTLFALATNGTGFTILHQFAAGVNNALFTTFLAGTMP